MKKTVLFCLLLCCHNIAFAKHIMGGYIQYTYVGVGSSANTSTYQITVTLYINCITGPTLPPVNEVVLGVFDASSNNSVLTSSIPLISSKDVSKTSFDPCLSDPPPVCYIVNTYNSTIELPDNPNGYVLAAQNVLRVAGIINVINSGRDGIIHYSTLPGVIKGVDYHKISSPIFAFQDTVVICHNSSFTYQFNATDPDGDTLTYAFGNGLNVSNANGDGNNMPPPNPPFPTLNYAGGYSGTSPLGSNVVINSATGIISGVAPALPGVYVMAVYVSKWKNGMVISVTKKELQISVADCSLTGAALEPQYINCDNFTFTFENSSTASNVASYLWTFGVAGSGQDTSTQATPTFTYPDTGVYTIKLKIYNTLGCSDSAKSTVKVYPGFTPAFTVDGSCYQTKFLFTDASYTKYGTINSWAWNFGDPSSSADTSSQQNPSWLYTTPGTATVTLAVTSTKGCAGTLSKTVNITDKPAIYLPFTDTLICSGDTLPLIAQSPGGTFTWAPAYNISDTLSATPYVHPTDTTLYTVTVKNKGCVGSATVTVNVLPFITVSLLADTGICKTDTITLRPVSYALGYAWKESNAATTLSSTTVKYPKASPSVTTTYYVTANLGHCQDSAKEKVYVSPYPHATVSADTTICYGASTRIYGSTNAPYYTWNPVNSLYQYDSTAPLAGPQVTTTYYFTVRDTFYCTKTVAYPIVITVTPPIIVQAGNDTNAVINQPLQLVATANNNTVSYTWLPATYLSNANIYNPVATITAIGEDSIEYAVTAKTPAGCQATGYIKIRLFATAPEIFVPSAFTPNGDGDNDIIRPILAGIAKLYYFRVYSRWGQCVFKTEQPGAGWDGNINGSPQPPGTYVFMAQGKDYLGNIISKNGTVVLVR